MLFIAHCNTEKGVHRDGIKRPKTIGAESIHMTLSYLGQDPKNAHFEFCLLHNDSLFHCGSTNFSCGISTSICMPRIKENYSWTITSMESKAPN